MRYLLIQKLQLLSRAFGALTVRWLRSALVPFLFFLIFWFFSFSKVNLVFLFGYFSRKYFLSIFSIYFFGFQLQLLEHEICTFYHSASRSRDKVYVNGTLRIGGKSQMEKGRLRVLVIKVRLHADFVHHQATRLWSSKIRRCGSDTSMVFYTHGLV